jgi:aminomethyltransferase
VILSNPDAPETAPRQTPLHDQHRALGAKMVDFAGWHMPLMYPTGVVAEHLATRRSAGLFDVSHMGRFIFRGTAALPFLQQVLTSNAQALDVGQAQYTFIPNEIGGAFDDAYLYRFVPDEYMLVVNAANRQKDWDHFQAQIAADVELRADSRFTDVVLIDRSDQLAMLSLQGPTSRGIIEGLLEQGELPEPRRNELSMATVAGIRVCIGRTGYTGEPLCFELFLDAAVAPAMWDLLIAAGATPAGLAARDTLRLEAGLPLYGHESGLDPEGNEIPIMSSPLAAFAVSFSPLKGPFVGRAALERQHAARAGANVLKDGGFVGWVTSGTMVPYWKTVGEGLGSQLTDEFALRSICLALLDCDMVEDEHLTVDVRGKQVQAVVVPYHLRSDAPPYARPIVYRFHEIEPLRPAEDTHLAVERLLRKTVENTIWRQRECINLIPSEMTRSPLVRLTSEMDPASRYAEHRKLEAFYEEEVFYYQGTAFIDEVERILETELCRFLDCREAETRVISGQMANTAVFSAMVDYINRGDTKRESRRIRMVMNNHIGRGGHLSAQPMGALKDFVAIDPRTDRPAVVNFPVLSENRYKTDIARTFELLEQYRPELIIFGKSMVLHKEPVTEVRRFVDEHGLDTVIMYDMAHVLGLVGPHFQQPFAEGVDLVTGSTHKTFFGTQRGVIGSPFLEPEERYELWESVRRRTFPGSVSNHHLGTLLGLLVATYEMNHFKEEYQPAVIANAKAFARALAEQGLRVAGDPAIDFTETHQVVVEVGYGRGPEIAQRLEENNIICNYQPTPVEEGFTAAGALRLGVAEMTRFGMGLEGFRELARLMADIILRGIAAKEDVRRLRGDFVEMHYCFQEAEYPEVAGRLRDLL